MDDLLREFVTETSENIEVVGNELVRFEQEPNNQSIIAQIFRLVHTIKGTCGFLGLPRLEALTHAAETAIDRFRDGAPVTREAVSLILATIDRIRLIISELDQTAAEPDGEDNELIVALEGLARSAAEGAGDAAAGPATEFTSGNLVYQVLERPLRPGEVSLDELEKAFRETSPADAEFAQDLLDKAGLGRDAPPAGAQEASEQTADPAARKSTIRVNVDTLERLMTMVSELVLTRNQLLELARRDADGAFKAPLQRLSQVTAELQDNVMKTRMQAIGGAWANLPRLIRDLNVELGKDILIETQGAETEIDRQLLELIRDPMLHIVRNAADHGIELPAERLKSGKPARGRIRVAAAQEGGFIAISISDDGRGLDFGKIKSKAVRQGLISEAEASRMPDQQAARIIFQPGFSTASAVTNISGRGVGMDVVRTNVEQMGGFVDVRSVAGEGTTVEIKIPLTLAIAAALVVEAHGHRFALPQSSVIELVRPSNGGETRIERLNDAPVLRLRERLLPLVRLDSALGIRDSSAAGAMIDKSFIVVCEVGRLRFGIIVDNVLQTEEIVVKPVSSLIRHLSCYSGATILGDGTVIMILDPNGLIHEIGGYAEAHNDNLSADEQIPALEAEKSSLLIFRAGPGAPKAVPLATVTRLEEIDVSKIERANGQLLVQYRGALMRLITCDAETRAKESGAQPVLVFSRRSRPVGLIVDEIIDIVEDVLRINMGSATPGVLGSAVLSGRATDIIDVAHFIPELGGGEGTRLRGEKRMLLCESSDFLRAMLGPVLQGAGYEVHAVSSPQEAESRLAWGGYHIVIANIEQAGMLTLPEQAGPMTRFVAIANRCSRTLLDAAHQHGFDDVVGIFDRQGLLASVSAADAKLGDAA